MGTSLGRLGYLRPEQAEAERARQAELKREGARRAAAYIGLLAGGEEPEREQPTPEPGDGLPACTACGSLRWLRPSVPHTDPSFGKIVRCRACLASPAIGPGLVEQAAIAAGVKPGEVGKTFLTFKASPESLEAARAARTWAQQPHGWLVVHGEPGSGKTHLAVAATLCLLERGHAVRFWYAPDLVQAIQSTFGQEGDATGWLLKSLWEQPVLVVDDLGAANPTPYTITVLEQLFNHRYRGALPTLVTLIGSPEQVKAKLSESIGRRMQDPLVSMVVHNRAPQWGRP